MGMQSSMLVKGQVPVPTKVRQDLLRQLANPPIGLLNPSIMFKADGSGRIVSENINGMQIEIMPFEADEDIDELLRNILTWDWSSQ